MLMIHGKQGEQTLISHFSAVWVCCKYKQVRDMSYSLKMDVASFFLFRPPRDDILCVVITKRIRLFLLVSCLPVLD